MRLVGLVVREVDDDVDEEGEEDEDADTDSRDGAGGEVGVD